MALERRDEAELARIQRQLAAEDPDCHRRLSDDSDRIAQNARPTASAHAPWVGAALVGAAVLMAALTLIPITTGA